MNIALEYTDEEKKLFDEAFRLKEEMNALQRESYVLRKERDEHVIENHTQGIPPIVYLALAFINLTIFISDLIVGLII